ncbi:MAG: hypothetical protein IPJ34_43150 [Myxococcales bacterium]|nr:hypothetical protein [Myxococcales bacterium]
MSLRTAAARGLAEQLSTNQVLHVVELREGLEVEAGAHVGRIQLDDVAISIEPKVGTDELLSLFRYAYSLRDLRRFDSVAFSTGSLLQDLLADQLLAEATNLWRYGLARRYVDRRELLATPRGRLDMLALARRWPVTDARLPCHYAERSTDHLLNRVLRAGLELAAKVVQDDLLRLTLRRTARNLADEIGALTLDSRALGLAEGRIDRQTTAYVPALRLIELLLAGQAVSLEGEEAIVLPGFLFDMNRFFQALLGKFLTENLAGFEVHLEHSLTDMMRYVPGLNPRRRQSPCPRPDVMVTQDSQLVAILDAKYRDLWERSLPREMLYQLAMYALSQTEPATATILYPTTREEATDAAIEIRDPLSRATRGRVVLRPVLLQELVGVLDGDDTAARRRLARRLVFGAER